MISFFQQFLASLINSIAILRIAASCSATQDKVDLATLTKLRDHLRIMAGGSLFSKP